VADLAADVQGFHLPQIERIRLSAQQSLVSKADRLREVRMVTMVDRLRARGVHGIQAERGARDG